MRVLLAVLGMIFASPARAEVPADPPATELVTAKEVKEQVLPKKDGDDAAAQAEAEEEKKKKEKLARVIVLKWNGKSADYTDLNLQRNVRSRISRPEAQFYPDVDLYQNGRKVRDRTVVPAMQPAVVPTQNVTRVMDAVDEIAALPERSLRPEAWGMKARELREMVELLWFVDRVELREPLFQLYAQIGRAAKFADSQQPQFFEEIGGFPVNYYYYMAAVLAYQDPALMSKLTDDSVREDVSQLLTLLKNGSFPTFTLDFQLAEEEGDFNLEKFSATYQVFLNGLELTDISDQGQFQVFFGRSDIHLVRKDSGYGLSERLEATKLEDKIYFVRDTARKKMGIDFIRQLFDHENECVPSLDGDILNFLSIYAHIHDKAEVYIAVPKYGNPNKVYIWRYDRPTAQLQFVQGGGDGFPVRFAVLASVGIMYNGADPTFDTDITPTDVGNVDNTDATSVVDRFSPNLTTAYIPVDLQLRGHYNRLMVEVGMEAGFSPGNTDENSAWTENYWLPKHTSGYVFGQGDVSQVDTDGDGITDTGDDGALYTAEGTPVYNEQKINRLLYIEHAVVLGRDAGIGLGPRIGLAIGYTNLPHAVQSTLHAGWTLAVPGVKPTNGRVRPILDVDLRGGGSFPLPNSLSYKDTKTHITLDPVFGLTAGFGTTF